MSECDCEACREILRFRPSRFGVRQNSITNASQNGKFDACGSSGLNDRHKAYTREHAGVNQRIITAMYN